MLKSIAVLVLIGTTYGSLEQVGGAALAIGTSLEIVDNDTLAALVSARTSKVALAPAASLTIGGNAVLPSSEICSFVSYESALGWSGVTDLGGVTCP